MVLEIGDGIVTLTTPMKDKEIFFYQVGKTNVTYTLSIEEVNFSPISQGQE